MSVTIEKLAQLADVSKSTVSRAFNNEGAGINARTRKRILNLAREMNYQPNILAKSLRSKRTHTLGLIVTDIENPFFASLAKSVEDRAAESNFHMLLGIIGNKLQKKAEYIRLFMAGRFDGLLVGCAENEVNLSHFDYFLDMKRRNFPFVVLGNMGQLDVDYVSYDDERAAFTLTSHLLDSGHRRIGLICDDPEGSRGRINGYRKAFYKRNIPLAEDLTVLIGTAGTRQARRATRQLLSMQDRPTAIIGVNDFVAFGILQAARECNMKVPQDLAVAGFDNIELVHSMDVPLTTVAFPVDNLAAEAINLLLKKIDAKEKEEHRHIILEPKLIIRQSTEISR
ncbi:MAG: LacI family transcriptional regulator [Phycisphaerae bacterium]|nr:LacI family transcriptional regulator [Phycisphaerae bacterium]